MSDKKSKPGRVVMIEGVPNYRGCMVLRTGSVQRLDEAATKDLVASKKAEVYEDYEKRVAWNKKAEEAKKKAAEKKAAKPAPKSGK